MSRSNATITSQIRKYSERRGQDEADQLVRLVYGKLKQIAGYYLKREQNAKTLQATALVNEALMQVLKGNLKNCENRVHFYRIVAQIMRRFLVDHARKKNR